MRRWLTALAVAGLLVTGACSAGHNAVGTTSANGYVAGSASSGLIPPASRRRIPNISGVTISGSPLTLADYRGRVVAINFWAHWCPPCREEVPDLEQLYSSEQSAGVVVVGVDIRDVKQLAVSFIKKHHVTYPILWDPDSKIALSIPDAPTQVMPSTIVLDKSGRIAATVVGQIEDTTDFKGKIDQLLKE